MYVCGVTVYDYCHIGHARSAIVFDVIRSYLQYRGYEVLCVKNFTDVDDKIIKRAQEEGISTQAVAEKYIAAHNEDMGRLGVRPADIEPKATEHIEEMLTIVKQLVDEGFAYPVDGDVYFAVEQFPGYGKLSGRKLEDMQSGTRFDVDERKRNPLDFALWKASKPDEPSWKSPWGPGRPGWHIECSAMSSTYLGHTFDIHGGGKDLIFPHHENEIAQSEAFTKQPFATYWLHNGFLSIHQEKMSKSLGNFFTIREVLDTFNPGTIRFLMLSTHYRSPLDYSQARLQESETALKRFHNTFNDVAELQRLASPDEMTVHLPPDKRRQLDDIPERIAQLKQAFEEAMDDDFNTAAAIGTLFEMLKVMNTGVRLVATAPQRTAGMVKPLTDAAAVLEQLGAVLGLTLKEEGIMAETEQSLLDHVMALILDIRKEARAEKNWALADRIRDGLQEIGISVKDRPGGESSWTLET